MGFMLISQADGLMKRSMSPDALSHLDCLDDMWLRAQGGAPFAEGAASFEHLHHEITRSEPRRVLEPM